MTKKSALEVLGAFLSFFLILWGAYMSSAEVLAISDSSGSSTTYNFTVASEKALLIGSTMISAGLTYLWFQRRK